MNGKTARLFRKFTRWAGVTTRTEQRARQRAWLAMPHRERGRTRARAERAMEADPRALKPIRRNHPAL
jgi:hypothetical protein